MQFAFKYCNEHITNIKLKQHTHTQTHAHMYIYINGCPSCVAYGPQRRINADSEGEIKMMAKKDKLKKSYKSINISPQVYLPHHVVFVGSKCT